MNFLGLLVLSQVKLVPILLVEVLPLLVSVMRALREAQPNKMFLAGAGRKGLSRSRLNVLLVIMFLLGGAFRRIGGLFDLPQLVRFGLDLHLEHVKHGSAHACLVLFHIKNYGSRSG